MRIVNEMSSSNILAANSRAKYAYCIEVAMLKIKHKQVLPLPLNMGGDEPDAKALNITNLDSLSTYIYYQEDILFIIQALRIL